MTRRSNLRYKMYVSLFFEATVLVLLFFCWKLQSRDPHLSVFCFLTAMAVDILSFSDRFYIFRQGFSEINQTLVKQLENEVQQSARFDFLSFLLFAVAYQGIHQSTPVLILSSLILVAAAAYRVYLLECKLQDLTFEEYMPFLSEKPLTGTPTKEDRRRIALWYNQLREKLRRGDTYKPDKVNTNQVIKDTKFN